MRKSKQTQLEHGSVTIMQRQNPLKDHNTVPESNRFTVLLNAEEGQLEQNPEGK